MTSQPKLYQGKPIASICRLCFMERKRLVPIFTGNSRRFCKWIEKLTSLKISNHPNAPTSLCTGCNSALEAFDAFREMCITNDRAFRETFDSDCTQVEEVTASEIKVEYDEGRKAVPGEQQRNNVAMEDQFPATREIKIEYEEHQQTDIAEQRDGNALTNDEGLRGQKETEIEPTDLLELGETKIEVQDIADKTVEANMAMGIRLPEIATNNIFGSNPVEDTQVNSLEIDSSSESESMEPAELEAIECSDPNMTEASDLISLRSKAKGSRYQCKTCNSRTSKLHALTHKDRDAFQCFICAKWFKFLLSLYRHIDKRHEGAMISDVDYHEGEPVGDDRKKDQIMEIVFAKGEKRRARREKSRAFAIDEVVPSEGHSQGPLPVLRSADVEVVSENDLFGNIRLNVFNHLKSQCKVCSKITSMLHTRSHKAEELFQCFICQENFNVFNDLKQHINYWHSNGDKQLMILPKLRRSKGRISVEQNAITPMNGVELNEQEGSDNAPPELEIDVYETKVKVEDMGSESDVEEVTDECENALTGNNGAKEITCQLENCDSEIVDSKADDNEIVMSNQEPQEDEDLTDGDGETVLVVVVQEDIDASEVEDSKGRGKNHQAHASAAPELVEEDYEMKNADEVIQIDSSDEGDD